MNTLFTTFLLTALATVVSSEELKASDVPQACMAICGPIVTLTNTCDINPDGSRRLARRQDNDGDSKDDETDEPIEAQCICNNRSFNVRSVAALCAACLTQNRGKTEGEFERRKKKKKKKKKPDSSISTYLLMSHFLFFSFSFFIKCTS